MPFFSWIVLFDFLWLELIVWIIFLSIFYINFILLFNNIIILGIAWNIIFWQNVVLCYFWQMKYRFLLNNYWGFWIKTLSLLIWKLVFNFLIFILISYWEIWCKGMNRFFQVFAGLKFWYRFIKINIRHLEFNYSRFQKWKCI